MDRETRDSDTSTGGGSAWIWTLIIVIIFLLLGAWLAVYVLRRPLPVAEPTTPATQVTDNNMANNISNNTSVSSSRSTIFGDQAAEIVDVLKEAIDKYNNAKDLGEAGNIEASTEALKEGLVLAGDAEKLLRSLSPNSLSVEESAIVDNLDDLVPLIEEALELAIDGNEQDSSAKIVESADILGDAIDLLDHAEVAIESL